MAFLFGDALRARTHLKIEELLFRRRVRVYSSLIKFLYGSQNKIPSEEECFLFCLGQYKRALVHRDSDRLFRTLEILIKGGEAQLLDVFPSATLIF